MDPIAGWINGQHKWLRKAASILLGKEKLSKTDIDELTKLCIKEVIGELEPEEFAFPQGIFGQSTSEELRLCSIGDLQGINALAPRNPLSFGDSNIAIVYGQNGSGKSGYVRILKHCCGARIPGTLHPNVFLDAPVQQSATISYQFGDNSECQIKWDVPSGVINDLRAVDIFDAVCGRVYLTDEHDVTYEPPVLLFFSDLIAVCEAVSSNFDDELAKLVPKKPNITVEHQKSELGRWYLAINYKTTLEVVAQNCEWTADHKRKREELKKRFLETSPAEKAIQLKKQKEHIDFIIGEIEKLLKLLSDENCQLINDLRKDYEAKRAAAKASAEQIFNDAPLQGIGTDVWKLLWEQARKYSEEQAYKEASFPFTGDDARCVLCHQLLAEEAKKRILGFEEFVKGGLEQEVIKAEKTFWEAYNQIEDITTDENLDTKIDAAGGFAKPIVQSLESLYQVFRSRKEQLLKANSIEDITPLPNDIEWLQTIKQQSRVLEEWVKKYEEDAQTDNREELEKELLELETRSWLSQQKQAILDEISQQKTVEILKAAKQLTNTGNISKKKGELAEELITDAFVKRFNDNLKDLGAQWIKIELIKTRVEKGVVLHRMQLRGIKAHSLEEILSEGEHRIVCLAAFLADVEGKPNVAPFVFDDPISSLDQDFEEAVVRRLVILAGKRQVIVFTHRLSLLGLLQEYGNKSGIEPEVICVRRENWGTGEPGNVPIWAKKTDTANNELLDHKLREAEKVLDGDGHEVYEIHAKSLCSEIRTLVEKTIEYDLMADVVQRYRRSINTKGKIEKLPKIEKKDCDFLDELMTKYSRYEHSQPDEAPVSLPEPDELRADLTALKEWRDEFKKRPVPV